jgi:hypothetical protein
VIIYLFINRAFASPIVQGFSRLLLTSEHIVNQGSTWGISHGQDLTTDIPFRALHIVPTKFHSTFLEREQ